MRGARASLAVVGLALALGASAPAGASDPAHAHIAGSATLNARASAVLVTGVVTCTGCRRFTLGATVSQRSSGAVAQGGVRCVCHGSRERWLVTARAREATRFQPGRARVCVWLIARGSAEAAIDANQWCENVSLRFAGT
ncbi:MAG: hypothetical protein QOD37_116 [Gaiellales bacterium]|jgi:hypothetical protein|nr:hypothetical protein [Gaiellales bacterium]